MKDKNFFIEELKKVTLENKRRITEKRVFIQCPYHGKDNTPSFKINIDPNNRKAAMGSGYCFACKTKKTWNELCEKLGMTPLKTDSGAGASGIGYVMRASEDTKKALLGEDTGVTIEQVISKLDKGATETLFVEDIDENWRGIDKSILKAIKCKVTIDSYGNKSIILPVRVNDVLHGGVKGIWELPKNNGENGKRKVLKYINMEGEWIKNYGLFPYDLVESIIIKKRLDYVILVEGQRDALKLLLRGYPALAILGTGNWSETKRNLVLSLGVSKVIIFMDSDDAGKMATKTILQSLKGRVDRFAVRTSEYEKTFHKIQKKKGITKEERLDPGNCPKSLLKEIMDDYECEPFIRKKITE